MCERFRSLARRPRPPSKKWIVGFAASGAESKSLYYFPKNSLLRKLIESLLLSRFPRRISGPTPVRAPLLLVRGKYEHCDQEANSVRFAQDRSQ